MGRSNDYTGFRLRLTPWGGLFLFLVLLIGFAAVNTGNNGLMLVVSCALGSYVVSGVWSRQTLGSIHVNLLKTPEIFAGRPAIFEIEVENSSRLFPAPGLVLRDENGRVLAGIDFLGRRRRMRVSFPFVLKKRGWTQAGPWRLEILLPLGFFRKSKAISAIPQVLVYPELREGRVRPAMGQGQSRGALRFTGLGREGEVFQLRIFREGDDGRQIHWKQSARQGKLIAMDRRRVIDQPIVLSLDPRAFDPGDAQSRVRFEEAVSALAMTLLKRLERRETVLLKLGDKVLGPENDRKRAGPFLEMLAIVQAGRAPG